MNEEKLKVLNMISEGKISAEDGAKLLDALKKSPGNRPHKTKRKGRSITSMSISIPKRMRTRKRFTLKCRWHWCARV
jgi:polyhydroxyalkanoate synthesis regulator phasin